MLSQNTERYSFLEKDCDCVWRGVVVNCLFVFTFESLDFLSSLLVEIDAGV